MSKMIAAERDLLNRLRAASRRILGPEASDTEVEARARRAYEGPKLPEVVLTPEEEEARERQFAENLAEADRAGVIGPVTLFDSTELWMPTPRKLHTALAELERRQAAVSPNRRTRAGRLRVPTRSLRRHKLC